MNDDFSTLPEEFENDKWKFTLTENEVSYEYAGMTFDLTYECEGKTDMTYDVVHMNIKPHIEIPLHQLETTFGMPLLRELQSLDFRNVKR